MKKEHDDTDRNNGENNNDNVDSNDKDDDTVPMRVARMRRCECIDEYLQMRFGPCDRIFCRLTDSVVRHSQSGRQAGKQ